jgi:uncharacterized protein
MTALIVFAKAPVPGHAKTRLAPALGAAGAAVLAERLLEHAVHNAMAGGHFAEVELCTTPDATHPAFTRLAALHPGLVLQVQGEGDLGARMHRALARQLERHAAALLIGTDAPALDTTMLQAAAHALQASDAVFVPAHDGGYALVGLKAACAALFEDIPWSTAAVMAQTRARLRSAGLRWAELPAVPDIDEPADLVHLPAGWLP